MSGRISAVGKSHCSKCRKVSGTGSNAVHWARPENLTRISGQDQVHTYTQPAGWRTAFCSTCGSMVPAMPSDESMWFVPAGLLNEDPGVGVRGHIWVSGKPAWDVIGDDTPQFDGNA